MWALTKSTNEEYLISGGGDSVINLWHDTTEIEAQKKAEEGEQLVLMYVCSAAGRECKYSYIDCSPFQGTAVVKSTSGQAVFEGYGLGTSIESTSTGSNTCTGTFVWGSIGESRKFLLNVMNF